MHQQPTNQNPHHAQCSGEIDAGIERLIGDKLRHQLAHIIDDPIPDCFIELLDSIACVEFGT